MRGLGFPSEKITVVQNAIDTKRLASQVETARRMDEVSRCPHRCLFVGGMYPEKRLDFLLEGAQLIRDAVPDFELALIGAGPDQGIAERAASDYEWIRYLGPLFDDDLAKEYASARLVLMPGLVGLGVLDSFAAGVPMVTTAVPFHSPEIEYLVDGVNGVIVEDWDSVEAYAGAVTELLLDDRRREQLAHGCRESAKRYTVEEMVRRFADGVLLALDAG